MKTLYAVMLLGLMQAGVVLAVRSAGRDYVPVKILLAVDVPLFALFAFSLSRIMT